MSLIIKWKTISNYVSWSKDLKDKQIIRIYYLEGWEEKTKEIDLVDFARALKRSDKILAKRITNLDWRDVYITKQINPETKVEYYLMKPDSDEFNVTLDYEGKEITILSTYLNA